MKLIHLYGSLAKIARVTALVLVTTLSFAWTPTGSLGTARASHTATLLTSGLVLVTGGTGDANNALASSELYSSVSGSWTFTGDMKPPQPTAPPLQNANKARTIKKRGQEAKRQALYRMSGVDITPIDAIVVETVEVVLSEYGADLSCFPTEKQFVSHVTLAPHVAKSGGKPVKKKKRNSASTRVAAALRMAALSLRHSQTALGAYYRKIARRIGGDVAVFATARK